MSLKNISTTSITVADPREGKYQGQPISVILPVPIKIVTGALLVLFTFMLATQQAPQAQTAGAISSGVSEKI